MTGAKHSKPPYAALALSLTVQEWTKLGVDEATQATPDLDLMVDRVAALLLVRLVAVATRPKDCSTAGICRTALLQQHDEWPAPVTSQVVEQVEAFVRAILGLYPANPYHSAQHAVHVVLSTAHMIDQMLTANQRPPSVSKRNKRLVASSPSLFGLRRDPISLFALVFAALIHDVEHPGIPNRQLSAEDDDLAILYSDTSIAEQHSLHVGFQQLLQPHYSDMKQILAGPSSAADAALLAQPDNQYRRFRRQVIGLVLNTDIASPERTQLFKSKWKEAFPTHHYLKHINSMSSMESSGDDDEDEDDLEAAGDDGDGGGGGGMLEHLRRKRLGGEAPSLSGGVRGATKGRSSSLPNSSTSAPPPTRSFRQRLGIRRSMDLSGEAIEAFSTHSHHHRHSGTGDPEGGHYSSSDLETDEDDEDDDDWDELKASVVMECILTACDVAHNLQGWSQMCIWSKRLYCELQRAHIARRGPDPAVKWFENQIGFLESYLMPLAHRLEETGAFELKFSRIVRGILDQWLVEGIPFTDDMIQQSGAPDDSA